MMQKNNDLSCSSKLTFFVSLLCGGGYFLAWYFLRYDGWKSAFNIPGFILGILSMPWSLIATNEVLASKLSNVAGQDGRVFLQCVVVSFGFATNTVLIKLFFCMIFRKIKKYWE